MIEDLIREYVTIAEAVADVDYSDENAVHRFNASSDRMRSIVSEVVAMGQDAVSRFAIVLETEPAAAWAAHHLVELAELDAPTRLWCFKLVELAIAEAEETGHLANAMGEESWLNEWRAKSGAKN